MKAMVLETPGRLVELDVPTPQPKPDEVLIKVSCSGICGTDLKIFDGGMPAISPLILGHEITGTIDQGEGAGGLKPGTRVIVNPTVICGDCFHCNIGQTHLCPNGGVIGREYNGGFAEYVPVPAINVYALPDEIADEPAAFIQVFSTCLHAQRLASIVPGEAVCVFGLGVTGQLHIQLARAAGADPIIGITRSEWKRDLAAQYGADITLAPGDDLKQQVLDATHGRGVDLAIETVGKLKTLGASMDLVRIGGRIVPFGIYTETTGSLPFYDFYYKELQIINGRASKGEAFPASIDLVQSGAVKLEPLISHVLPLDQLGDAIAMLASEDQSRMKVILKNA
jgi:2-desacetyl-2-hydroxyethyl bacteriochlorophyllide A dehydrogenase